MLTIEHFKRDELIAVVIFAFVWAALSCLLARNFYTSIIATFMMMTLMILLTCRLGRTTLFLVIGIILVAILNLTGLVKLEDGLILGSMIFASMIFEIAIPAISKLGIKRISFNVIIPAVVASATIPWTILFLSGGSIGKLNTEMINFMLASAASAVLGAMIALVIWEFIKTKKFILRILCS